MLPLVVLAQSKRPSVLVDQVDRSDIEANDVVVDADFKMGKHRGVPEMST